MRGFDPWIGMFAMIGGSFAILLVAGFRLKMRERSRRASSRAWARSVGVRDLGPLAWA